MKSFKEFYSHGEAHLGGKDKYKIVGKRVPAKHIYTNSNSIHEWGYDSHDQI